MTKEHKCQWCSWTLQERHMKIWNDRWECKSPFMCSRRYRSNLHKQQCQICKQKLPVRYMVTVPGESLWICASETQCEKRAKAR